MTFSASVLRKAALLAAFALVAGLWATTAVAQTAQYPVTGNARYQIGNGLPIPIGLTPAPVGKVKLLPGGVITQTTGPDPKKMILPPSGATHPGTPAVVGLFGANPALFQVATAIPLAGPKVTATFSAGGRTGAAVVSWCPGQTVPPGGNPGCISAGGGPGINGLARYTATSNQFGGVNQGNVGGFADIAIVAGGIPPGTVTAIFAIANPFPTGAQGAPFGFFGTTLGSAPAAPNGLGGFIANANGTLVTQLWAHPTQAGLPNPATTYGAPWTTGRLTLHNTAASPTELFTFTGSDNRVNGVGTISLVSGGLSQRGISGPNANRGWLNLTIGPELGTVSAVSNRGLAAVFGLLALAGGYALHRSKGRF